MNTSIENQNQRRQPRSQLNLVLLVVLAVLLIAASIILIVTLPDQQVPAVSSNASVNATAPAQLAGFTTDASEAQQLYPLENLVVRVSRDRVVGLDLNGAEVFATDISMTSPLVARYADRLLVIDKEGLNYLLVSTQGVLASGSTNNVIRGSALAGDGHFALITEPAGSTGVVSIHSADGQWLFDCLFPDSGFVLGVAFTGDSSAFDVSLLNTDGSAIYPLLKRFSITGEQTGQRELTEEAILPLIVYDASDEPVLCGSSELLALSYTKDEPSYGYTFPVINSVAASEKGLVVLNSDVTGGRQRLTLCPPGGKAAYTIEIGEIAAGMDIKENLAVIASSTSIFVVDLKDGKIRSEQNLASEVVRAAFGNDQTITAVTRAGVQQLAIPAK